MITYWRRYDMTPTQYNLTVETPLHCYAVYNDLRTGLIGRDLIVSPIRYNKLDSAYIIIRVGLDSYRKLFIRNIKDLIISRIKWSEQDLKDNSQRTGL